MLAAARAHLTQAAETRILRTVARSEARVTRKLGFERERREFGELNLVLSIVLFVRVSTPGRHPKTLGFNVAEGRI